MSQSRSVLAHLRAAVLAAVCLVAVVAALPMPGPPSVRHLRGEAGQAELGQWVEILGGVGIRITNDELADWVMWVGRSARKGRSAVVGPFAPAFRLTGTQQGWGLFAYPDTHPYALVVEGAALKGPYRALYRSQDPEHRWLAGRLHYRRLRALYNPGERPPRTYAAFVTWLAGVAFDEFPDIDRVQVHFTRQRTALPWEEVEPEVSKLRHRQVRTRMDEGVDR